MTRTYWPDGNEGQADITNPNFRHLSENRPEATGQDSVTQLPRRYLTSSCSATYEHAPIAKGGEAPVFVAAADTDRKPSQISLGDGRECPNKCHVDTLVPDTTQILVIRPGVEVLLDAEDADRLGDLSWYLLTTKQGKRYVVAHVAGGLAYLHREVLGVTKGQIDHVNGNGLDNRRCNLRLATPSQNRANSRKRRPATSASPFKGVLRGKGNRWIARCSKTHLGSFGDQETAARAYDVAAKAKWGEFALLNFPEVS